MAPSRIVFAGTPDFAVPALRLLIDRQRPVAVLTQPDRPAGRGRRTTASPVKQCAVESGIPVMQPRTLRDAEARRALLDLEPDLLVTAAYGLLLPKAVLDAPRIGCWNLHASLLPRWRGASPIQQAILAGDARTGISLMQMDEGLDTGDVLMAADTPIGERESAGELHDRLSGLAAGLLGDALEHLDAGTLPDPVPQDDAEATHAPRIAKADARIDWTRNADEIERMVRAYDPWPVAHGDLNGAAVRVFRSRAEPGDSGAAPGTLLTGRGHSDEIRVACGRGVLCIEELQRAGRRRVSAAEWLNAHPDWRG